MKVCVSVKSRFHAFYLAEQLQKRGYLQKLITTYPKFEVQKYGISNQNIESLCLNEIAERLWRKMPGWIKQRLNAQYFFHEWFDRRAKSYLDSDSDILVCWSSFSLHTLRKAKQLGVKKIILERGSSHIEYQQDILHEEYQALGLKSSITHHPSIIEKEIMEYQETDYISVPSGFVKQTFLDKGFPESKLIHVPYGVNLSKFYPQEKNEDKFRIIFCGCRSIRKGVHYLLQAFFELHLPLAELWFIGSCLPEVLSFQEKYASDNIRYLGPFSEFELAHYYSQGSVFCLPSLEEGLAMVIPQAMACGLPVICSTNTGGADIVRDGQDGYIIPIRNIDVLKEKIVTLYENPSLLKQMSESAVVRVSAGFTWDDYGNRMVKHYERILT